MAKHNTMWTTVACDLCGSDLHDELFVKEGYRHVRCRDCGLVFVSPRKSGHWDVQIAGGTGSMGEEALTAKQRRRFHREVDALQPYRKLNRVLEIGAGRGWFLQEAILQSWETWAVEINRDALERLRSLGVKRIISEPAEEVELPPKSFDVVRMWDVIEHLESPRKAMQRIHAALRPGGLFRLSTTNFASLSRWVNGPDWVYLNGADHIVLFEPATVTRLLETAGFTGISVTTRSFNLRKKRYFPEAVLPTSPRWLIPLRKVIDELIGITRYGHQMIVTAGKAG